MTLKIGNVSVRYGSLLAVRDASLDILATTGVHALIGPNGSGKSSLLKAIAGLVQDAAGVIRLGDDDLTRRSPLQRVRAGIVLKFQVPRTFSRLTVAEHLAMAARTAAAGRRHWADGRTSLDEDCRDFLEYSGLVSRSSIPASSLSHGELQWLEILMCISQAPRFLLLDEPTAGLSPQERRLTGELFRRLASRLTVVLVEHDLDFVRSVADMITVLHQGRIVATGTVDEIQSNPEVRRVYVSRH